ncbi:MAG: TonB-dependent receptor [Chitinophagaceae bacterium]|nr:TonB-dependent receptor [Chitinophagaceae bacterium]
MKKTALLFLIMLMVLTVKIFAQNKSGKISGAVTDDKQKGIDGATISLLNSKDAKLVKVDVTDKNGRYEFDKIADGSYIVSVTVTGFQKKASEPFSISADNPFVTINTLQLLPAAKSLGEVTVTGKRPLIENKIDRTVVNVEAAPTNAGASALEVLEKSPGITVDNDGNISLKGKQGVIVMMDGKPTYLSPTDLANVLRNLPASALDQIEIMTNPPARYDASGNSGIINIKTKKGKTEGFNGSFTTGGTVSFYKRDNSMLTPVRSSNSLNMNYRKGKMNVFGNLNYNYNENRSDLFINRKLYDQNGNINIISNAESEFNGRNNNYTAKFGFDFFQSKKTVWGVVLNGFTFFGRPHPKGSQIFTKPDGTVESVLESEGITKLNFANYSGNVNFKHTFDSTGKEVTVDLDYVGYSNTSTSLLITDSYNEPGRIKTGRFELKGDIPGVIDIYSIKSDYTHPLKNDMRFEAGFKLSYVNNNNEVEYQRMANNTWVKDNRSNHFIYQENINAAYVSINKKWKKFSGQAGLRMENTQAKGKQITNDSTFNRNYTGLFPTMYLNYEVNKSHTLTLSYGRRIMRPNYQDLNPFIWFLDSLTYRQGNPYLLPQYSNNFEIRHSYKNGFTTVINYTQTDDAISQLLVQPDLGKRITFLRPDNVASQKNIGLAITAPVKIAKWWSSNIYFNLYNNHFTGIHFNPIKQQNDQIDVEYTSYMINVSNNFNFQKGWSGEISGFYRAKGVDGLSISDEMYFLTLGAQKTIMQGKGTLRMNFRDPFHWQKWGGTTRYSNIDVRVTNIWNNRALSVSFSYRFGKTTVAQARRRTSGANDEESRAGQQQ